MTTTATEFAVPAFVRGTVVDRDWVTFEGFRAPDPHRLVEQLPLSDPLALRDVQELPFEEIVAYLHALGEALVLERNVHLQEALERSSIYSDMTAPLVRSSLEQLPALFAPALVTELAEATIGIAPLEGWVPRRMSDGRTANVRAFGARAVHLIAGNSPLIAALTVIRNAVARSDAIVKLPSNDPLTTLAIARTMGELAPDHPITQHLAVAYWKGGDKRFEERLLQPAAVEKIVAWGGFASVTHVLRYVQPGLELISLDPKRSATIIGPEAFDSDATLADVALSAATDIGALNQLGCVNARVIYLVCGTDPGGVERANRLGAAIYEQLLMLPESLSTKPKWLDPELSGEIEALRASPEWYRVFGGGADGGGAVIVSQLDEPVAFHRRLSGRVANLVPIDDAADAVRMMNAYTQTVGVYPEALKERLRDVVPLHGAQRLVSLGYAAHPSVALPQDAIEPLRRMVKWIVDESCDPLETRPLWQQEQR
jgi:hypothetical protein